MRVLVFPSTWYSSFLMACQSDESKVVPYFYLRSPMIGEFEQLFVHLSVMVVPSFVTCLFISFLFFCWVSSLFFFFLICMSVHISPLLGFDIAHLFSFVFVTLLCLRCPELKKNPHFYIVKSIMFVLFESCLKCFLIPKPNLSLIHI